MSYLGTGFLIYCINDINKSLEAMNSSNNSLEMLGIGISKIFLIPILIIIFLLLVGCVWTTFTYSIRILIYSNNKLKIIGIILLVINIVLVSYTVHLILKFLKILIWG